VYYVGETDAFAARLQQHRNKKAGGQQQQQQQWRWADVACVAVAVSDKSTARALEADLIRALVHSGVPLLSENDGKHRNFGAGSSFAR
jgi:predicted GIY-YIG superfamily endonuclease